MLARASVGQVRWDQRTHQRCPQANHNKEQQKTQMPRCNGSRTTSLVADVGDLGWWSRNATWNVQGARCSPACSEKRALLDKSSTHQWPAIAKTEEAMGQAELRIESLQRHCEAQDELVALQCKEGNIAAELFRIEHSVSEAGSQDAYEPSIASAISAISRVALGVLEKSKEHPHGQSRSPCCRSFA